MTQTTLRSITNIGIWIPMLAPTCSSIVSRASYVPIDIGHCIRDGLNPRHRGSSDEIIVEHVGANMGIQIPLLVIDQRVVSVMSACLPNP